MKSYKSYKVKRKKYPNLSKEVINEINNLPRGFKTEKIKETQNEIEELKRTNVDRGEYRWTLKKYQTR